MRGSPKWARSVAARQVCAVDGCLNACLFVWRVGVRVGWLPAEARTLNGYLEGLLLVVIVFLILVFNLDMFSAKAILNNI